MPTFIPSSLCLNCYPLPHISFHPSSPFFPQLPSPITSLLPSSVFTHLPSPITSLLSPPFSHHHPSPITTPFSHHLPSPITSLLPSPPFSHHNSLLPSSPPFSHHNSLLPLQLPSPIISLLPSPHFSHHLPSPITTHFSHHLPVGKMLTQLTGRHDSSSECTTEPMCASDLLVHTILGDTPINVAIPRVTQRFYTSNLCSTLCIYGTCWMVI